METSADIYRKFNTKFGNDSVTIDSTFSNVQQIENRMRNLVQQYRQLCSSTHELRTLRDSLDSLPSSEDKPQKVEAPNPMLFKVKRMLGKKDFQISSSNASKLERKVSHMLEEFRKITGRTISPTTVVKS